MAQAVGIPVSQHSACRLAAMLVATKKSLFSSFSHPPHFFPSVATFSHRRSARINPSLAQTCFSSVHACPSSGQACPSSGHACPSSGQACLSSGQACPISDYTCPSSFCLTKTY